MDRRSHIPRTASVYELVRLRPAIRGQLSAIGVTDEYFDYRIAEAARAVGVSTERIEEIAGAR